MSMNNSVKYDPALDWCTTWLQLRNEGKIVPFVPTNVQRDLMTSGPNHYEAKRRSGKSIGLVA